MSRLLGLARSHRLFALLLVPAIALRVVTQFAYKPALFLHADTYFYLLRADDLSPGRFRPSLYPLFLRLLSPIPAIASIPAVQHLLTIGVAILLYAFLLGRVGRRGAAAAAVVPLLFDAYQLNVEQAPLSETLFGTLVVSGLVCAAWSVRPHFLAAAASGLLLGCGVITRPVGILVLPVVALYLLWKRSGWVHVALFAVGAIVPVAGYATWHNSELGSFAISSRTGHFLYARVAPFAECGSHIPEGVRMLCDPRPPSDRPGTGFYMWSPQSPKHRLASLGDEIQNARLGEFARRVILHQPGDYAATVGAEFLKVFSPLRVDRNDDESQTTYTFPRTSEEAMVGGAREDGDSIALIVANNEGAPPDVSLFGGSPHPRFQIEQGLASFLHGYQKVFFVHGPVLAVLLLLGLAGGVVGIRRHDGVRRETWLFCIAGMILVAGSFAGSTFDYRYVLPALPLWGAAAALGATSFWPVPGVRGAEGEASGAGRPEPRSSERNEIGPSPGE